MSDKTVVLAIFDDEMSADSAAPSLKDSGAAQGDAIGSWSQTTRARSKPRRSASAAPAKSRHRAALALFTPVGLGAGLIGGGLLGALHHKGLGLDQADRDRLGAELAGGKAAVGVLAPVPEAGYVATRLSELGGAPETHVVTDEALQEAEQASAADESS